MNQTATGKERSILLRFLPYVTKYKKILFFDLLCASLTTVCEMVLPLIMRYLTDVATVDAAALSVAAICRMGTLYFLLRVVDAAANYYMAGMGHGMGVRIETDMRRDAFDHLQKLDNTYFANTKVGQLMSRMTSDLFDVTEFAHHCPEEFFIAGVKIIVSFVVLVQFNVALTLIIYLCIPVMVAVCSQFNHALRNRFREQRVQVGELNANLEDTLLGIRVVKAFCGETLENEKFAQGNNLFRQIKIKTYGIMASFNATTRMFDGLMYLLVIVLGGVFLRNGDITASDLVAYILYVSTLLTTVRRIIEFAEQFQRGMTGIARFYEIMDADITIFDEPNATELGTVRGDITFDNVTFAYPDDDTTTVLENINLSIHAGEKVALVGPSGGGKTTLCNLLPRFYDPTHGTISIDGIDVRSATLKSLRSAIGIVQQDVYLFGGTVGENIAYGKQDATRAEIEQATRLAGAHDFIMKLPNGYDTYVGERGVKLSGGQKQRISIARVFLKNPPILVLDEATSALDNESEALVGQSLANLAKGRTTLTIAHRLTTIKNADRILVLGTSGIEEQGTHEQLLARDGAYAKLWNGAKALEKSTL